MHLHFLLALFKLFGDGLLPVAVIFSLRSNKLLDCLARKLAPQGKLVVVVFSKDAVDEPRKSVLMGIFCVGDAAYSSGSFAEQVWGTSSVRTMHVVEPPKPISYSSSADLRIGKGNVAN